MALTKTIIKDIPLAGTVLVPAYCKVVSLRGDKDMLHASMVATKDDANGEFVDGFQVHFVPDLDGPNFISQAYAHFKSLPALAGAQDC